MHLHSSNSLASSQLLLQLMCPGLSTAPVGSIQIKQAPGGLQHQHPDCAVTALLWQLRHC
jgi:hypothetical protein